jgi:protein-disulfide isomerase
MITRTRFLFAFLFLPLVPLSAAEPNDVVARVGEAAIHRSDLATEIPDEYKAQYTRVTGELRETQQQAVRELLGTRNIEATARQRHVDPEQIYREAIARDSESFTTAAQAKIHQIEASVYEADRLTLEEIIDRRLYDEATRRGLKIDTNIAFDDVAYLRAYEAARRSRVNSADPLDKQIADSAAEGRTAVLRQRMIAAARAVVPVQRFLDPPRVKVATAGFPRMGSADAPVQFVVFTDFECPYCAETEPVLKRIVQTYGSDVSLVMRDFPMPNRKAALPSAIAARCASMQGKYWPYHDLLFANRTSLTDENFRRFAAETGLNTEAFSQCLANPATRTTLEREIDQARAYGVDATPTMFINGRLLSGTATFEQLSRLIEAERRRPAG